MKYLILSQNSESYANQISAAIWKIRKPASNQSDTTQKYCGYITHNDGRVALVFPDELLKIHRDADLQPLSALIQAAHSSKEVKDSVADHFDNLLPLASETPPTIDNLMPPLFSANLKDGAFMKNDGWFPGDEV